MGTNLIEKIDKTMGKYLNGFESRLNGYQL